MHGARPATLRRPLTPGVNEKARNRLRALGSGAVERSRTSDLLITNQLLYQLSYNGIGKEAKF